MTERYLRVETTTDSRDDAAKIAEAVVEARAAACAQVVGPITSIYRWKGGVAQAEEYLVVMKTSAGRYADLERCIRGVHGYDVPEIVATPIVAGGRDYLDWIEAETAPSA